MEQHPVPQHIASYEFRLVGDMTLKQFLQVAAGALVALVFYALPIPGFLKWPLVVISGLIGTALAFMPIEERPLSAWFAAYIKAIYSPTYYAKSNQAVEDIFAPETQEVSISSIAAVPGGEKKAEEYLASLPSEGQTITNLNQNEQSFLQRVVSLFPSVLPRQKETESANRPRPQLIVEEAGAQQTMQIPKIPVPPSPQMQHINTPVAQKAVQQPVASAPVRPVFQNPQLLQNTTSFAPQSQAAQSTTPTASVNPNVVVGQVVDQEGNGIESAILEVRDAAGRPVRALRTNRVGHFLTVTPLQPGTYQIIVDKEGYEFETVQFTADNNVIKPITIRGRKLA